MLVYASSKEKEDNMSKLKCYSSSVKILISFVALTTTFVIATIFNSQQANEETFVLSP